MRNVFLSIIGIFVFSLNSYAQDTIENKNIEKFLVDFKKAIVLTDVTRRCDKHFVQLQTLSSADLDFILKVTKSRMGDKFDNNSVRLLAYSIFLDVLVQTYTAARADKCVKEIQFSD